jgi:hypothetical protein
MVPSVAEHPGGDAGREHRLLLATEWIARLIRPFGELSLEVLLSRDLAAPLPHPQTAAPLVLRQGTEDDLGWITRLYASEPYLQIGPSHEPELDAYLALGSEHARGDPAETHGNAIAQYRARLQRGERCFIALVDSEVAHVNWLCFRWGPVAPGIGIALEPGEAYTTDAITISKFRGMNIHAVVLGEMLREAQQVGCRRAFTVTGVDRRASFKAFRQLGWTVQGRFFCFVPRKGRALVVRLSGDIHPLRRRRLKARRLKNLTK